MINLVLGNNSFEIDRYLTSIKSNFDGEIISRDGENLSTKDLPDIIMGASLFEPNRLIIIRSLSDNKDLWPTFHQWIDRLPDDVNLVLVEPSVDKRTTTYKALKDVAKINEFNSWSDRDRIKAEEWLSGEAKSQGITLEKSLARFLVDRVGVDQWQLFYALDKLSGFDVITKELIEDTIDESPTDNVFELLNLALNGSSKLIKESVDRLQLSQDPFQLQALLSSQVFQLAAAKAASVAGSGDLGKDFGMHPFVASKLKSLSRNYDMKQIQQMALVLADADDSIKSSPIPPWIIIENALLRLASLNK